MPEGAVLLEGRAAGRHDVVLEHAGVELGRAVLYGLDAARDGGQDLVFDLDELYGLVGYLAGLRRDQRPRLFNVDALYPGVGVGAALGAADEQLRQAEVVQEGALARDDLARVLARDVYAAHIAVVLRRIVFVSEVFHLLPSHFSSSSTPLPATEAMASKTWYWLMQLQ